MTAILNLSFPEYLEGQEFLIETDPKQLKKAVNNEGSSHIASELSRISKLVFDLNRCPKSLSQTESILKIFHEKYSSLSNSLRDYSLDSINQSKKVDALIHELTKEMSFACKAYLMQLNENNKWVFGLPKKAAFAINYSIHYLSLLKAEHYSLDKPIPSYLWKELFQLYQFAEDSKLTRIKVKDIAENKISTLKNIMDSFSRASLMASMEPYNLSREETWNLYHFLGYVVSDNTITREKNQLKNGHYFAFNYELAQRPMLIKEQHEHNASSRYLNIKPFTQKIKQELKSFNSNTKQKYEFLSEGERGLQEKLLQLMYRYSVQYIARESDRYPVEVEAKVLWGYSEIVSLLKSGLKLNSYSKKEEFLDSFKTDTFETPLLWETVNESQGGACIKQQKYNNLDIAQASPLVISKQLPNEQGRWQFAVSRWHRTQKGADTVGVQYIKGDLQLAKIANKESAELVFIGPDNRQRYFLLTPKDSLNGGKNLILELASGKILVNKKGVFPCYQADLVQVELVKKSS